MEKYLQFALLGAHLDTDCSAEHWAFLAQQALDLNHTEQACAAYHQGFNCLTINYRLVLPFITYFHL